MSVAVSVRPFGKCAPWLLGVMWVNGMLNICLGLVTIMVIPS